MVPGDNMIYARSSKLKAILFYKNLYAGIFYVYIGEKPQPVKYCCVVKDVRSNHNIINIKLKYDKWNKPFIKVRIDDRFLFDYAVKGIECHYEIISSGKEVSSAAFIDLVTVKMKEILNIREKPEIRWIDLDKNDDTNCIEDFEDARYKHIKTLGDPKEFFTTNVHELTIHNLEIYADEGEKLARVEMTREYNMLYNIENKKMIKLLKIKNCYLTFMPEWISEFNNITSLLISDSYVDKFDLDLAVFKQLSKIEIEIGFVDYLQIPSQMLNEVRELLLSIKGDVTSFLSRFPNIEKLTLNNIYPFQFLRTHPNLIELTISTPHQNMPHMMNFDLNFDFASHLKYLYIMDCGINSISSNLFELKEVEIINLSNNKLYILPETISALPSLKKLILDDNPLKEIPLSLLECPILEMISIRNTFINVEPLFEKLLKLNNNNIEILY